jgi:hypothetical protein
MIEDYGTLSEEELVQELIKQLEDNEGIDASDLEFKFEEGKLIISGSLQNEDELEVLVGLLENYIDPKDYECNVELIEGDDRDYAVRSPFEEEIEEDEEEEDEEEDLIEEDLEKGEEEEAEFEDEDEDGGFDDDKW